MRVGSYQDLKHVHVDPPTYTHIDKPDLLVWNSKGKEEYERPSSMLRAGSEANLLNAKKAGLLDQSKF